MQLIDWLILSPKGPSRGGGGGGGILSAQKVMINHCQYNESWLVEFFSFDPNWSLHPTNGRKKRERAYNEYNNCLMAVQDENRLVDVSSFRRGAKLHAFDSNETWGALNYQ